MSNQARQIAIQQDRQSPNRWTYGGMVDGLHLFQEEIRNGPNISFRAYWITDHDLETGIVFELFEAGVCSEGAFPGTCESA